ncbi:unnamed protein product [Brassica oleracea var. botrytis]|uniref:Uncharacterized protein n=2 Tax=Brassica TaxID=3705 RepID=A0A8D9G4J2_BRACM|nr:unnamed protein product [Brassica napus]CAG7867854.1 unnamed protein product [Brassica rapa]
MFLLLCSNGFRLLRLSSCLVPMLQLRSNASGKADYTWRL